MKRLKVVVLAQALVAHLRGFGHDVVDASAPTRSTDAHQFTAHAVEQSKAVKPDFKLATAKKPNTAHWAQRIPHGQQATKQYHRQHQNKR